MPGASCAVVAFALRDTQRDRIRMNKQQAYLLDLGAEINEICQKHGIKFFLAHGSLIGAIRHGGIIPWDDDFDVFMPYDQWLKFKKVCQDPANLPPNRVLCCPDTQESYLHVMPRYVATDTTCIHKNQSLHDDIAGQVIDIFILDPVADDQIAAYQKDLFLYYDMLIYADTTAARVGVSVEEYQAARELIKQRGKLEACKEFEKRLESHFDENGTHYAHRWHGSATVFDRKDFSQQMFVPVGPYKMPVPSGYNGVMRSSFGDEWPIMPKNANAAKHSAPASLKIPYKDALEYFRPTHDREEIKKQMYARKPAVLGRGTTRHFLNDNWASLRASMVSIEVTRRVAAHQQEFQAALEARDGQVLNKILGSYVDWQIGRYVLGRRFAALFWRYQHPVFIQVDDQVFEALLLALMCTERIGRAKQLIDVRREKLRLPITPLMSEIESDIEYFRTATDSVCSGDVASALPTATELCLKYPAAISFWRFEVVCMDRERAAGNSQLLYEEQEILDQALERWPHDGYFLYYQLECRSAAGEDVAAEYPVAAELTANGLVLQDIQSRFGYAPSWLRNKRWAKANGVPQWNGPEPVLPSGAEPKPKSQLSCPCHEVCFQLLAELTSICDEHGLRYCCSADLAKTALVCGKAPARMESISLYMPAKDAVALASVLKAELPVNRLVSGLGVDNGSATTLTYSAAGTTGLIMKRPVAWQNGHLSVCVHVIIPRETPEGLRRVLAQYDKDRFSGSFKPHGAKAALYAAAHGVKGVSQKTSSKLVTALANVPVKNRIAGWVLPLGKLTPVAEIDFSDLARYGFAGLKLKAPGNLEAFASRSEAETAASLTAEPTFIGSAEVSYEDLMAKHSLPADFDERLTAYREAGKGDALIMQPFKENYAQLYLAVRLKELSLKLLPKKAKIVALYEAGDTAGLNKVLKGYKACYKKYHDVGEVFLDPEIDAALQVIL